MELELKNNNSKEILQKSKNSTDLTCEGDHQQKFHSCPISGTTLTPSMTDISQILPSLYLSGATCISKQILQQLSITLIINTASELPFIRFGQNIRHLYLNVLDRPDADISDFFDKVADLIDDNMHGRLQNNTNKDGASLIYCVAGISRSPTLCLAYLMRYAGMTLRDAYHHTKRIRPQIRPNTGFFQQLLSYEKIIYGRNSVRMIYYECLLRKIPDVYAGDYQAMEEFYQQQKQRKKQEQTMERTTLR